ncbi:hypothetical protein PHYPSEUDO_002602 [Phytophthora pseudosyringae]|uniref:Uncharacterized protein n=1 Tax=Phytophthora pseudosyringae TaxID=221518 RepID=A0A8T1VXU7_9STRA|nr:hypothetical protein PHYPSEUDO_002602 [Phytophthora pseudosyringae]
MKRARTTTTGVIGATRGDGSLHVESQGVATVETTSAGRTAAIDDNLAETVEQLRAELRRKDEELLRKDEDLRIAHVNFAELDVCSREVEQELESEISRLSCLNSELENECRNLAGSLRNELCRLVPHSSRWDCEQVAQLRRKLQLLEQENDDLQMCVRRLGATSEDLSCELERAQEECIFARQELESFEDEVQEAAVQSHNQIRSMEVELEEYKTLVRYLLMTVVPCEITGTECSEDIGKEALKQDPLSTDTDDTGKETNNKYDADYRAV